MFKNNWTLCRFILRRDWLRILFWFLGIAALVIGFGAALPDLFGSDEGRASMFMMMDNPAMVAMVGPVYAETVGDFTLGGMYALFMVVWTAAIFGIMNIFHVVRHTRQDEERGRIEVIRSLPVGRLASLSATLTTAVIINVAFALLLGLGLGAVGADDMDLAGGMLFGAVTGAAGLVFAAVTAVFCQLTANPRTAMSFSFAFLIGTYMLRAMGDMQEELEAVSLVSLLGMTSRAKIYIDNHVWPVLALTAAAAVIAIIAFMLCRRRDMGEGLIPARPGRKDAKAYLKSPGGLAWRLLKTPFIVWVITVPVLSMSYGSIMGDVSQFVESTDVLMQLTGGDPMRMVGFLMIIMSMCATIPVLQFILKARSQESRGYAEHVIARSASRVEQLRGYFIVALISTVIMPFMNCFGFWAASSAVMDEPFEFVQVLSACMVYSPAMMFMLGVAMLLIAYLPKYTSFAYMYLGYAFIIIYLGGMMGVPDWLNKLAPFGHIPMLPNVNEIGEASYGLSGGNITAMIVMTSLAAVMCVLGFIGYKNREMKFSQ